MNKDIKYSDILAYIKNVNTENKEIQVISNYTLSPIFDDYFKFYNSKYNIKIIEYSNYMSSTLSGNLVFIIIKLEELFPKLFDNIYEVIIEDEIKIIYNTIDSIIKKAEDEFSCVFICDFEYDFFEPEPKGITTKNYIIKKANEYLHKISDKYINLYLININKIIARIGADNFYNDRTYYMAKIPYSILGYNALAYDCAKIVNAQNIQRKKCLILDCDNVLWGGIVAEDGINNIRLSRSFIGSAYRNFQKEIIRLYHSGIIICLCSKNDEKTIWDVFDNHPDMLLNKKHISSFRINNRDKANNIREIIEELNISKNSVVFIDDDPYETQLAKSMIPDIETITLNNEQPNSYVKFIKSCKFFDSLEITQQDRLRGESYKFEGIRKIELKENYDIEQYHKSLKTKIEIISADNYAISRIAELSQRTSQFNLSNKRYSIEELIELKNSPTYEILYLKASDIYGDMGIITACVIKYNNTCLLIESFFLSCRVFGRNFELLLLDKVKDIAFKKGITDIIGIYIETEKNKKFNTFYKINGVNTDGIFRNNFINTTN
ncbi:MAG: hypothetical protein A2Y17_00710 [Clostridiales bacterium GWF2_38_85]|nr:MAG: hypothetical protein A2Y17_00710 [Clostridiales bacterium GWF2_38_85]